MKKPTRHQWNVSTDDRGHFNELAVAIGKSCVLHAEMTDDRSFYVDVAGVLIWVWVDDHGIARIVNSEDDRASVMCRTLDLRDPELDKAKTRKRGHGKR